MRRRWLWLLGIIAAIVVVLAVGGYAWLTTLPDPMPETSDALISDDGVLVETEPWLTFSPAEPSDTGFIFYPGGRVPAQAYAPAARSIAEAGHLSVVVPMPFGLAVISPDAAEAVMQAHPEIERWVIGGHSLGGAMAAQFAAGHDDVDGLALWAAYPPGSTDLSELDIAVTSVSASEDGLADSGEIAASAEQLPADTTFFEIDGGNHAQFGWYGLQDGDGVAAISHESQQEQTLAATLALIEAVDASSP